MLFVWFAVYHHYAVGCYLAYLQNKAYLEWEFFINVICI